LSGSLSENRESEARMYPVLYRAKLLLRETLFYDFQQPEPVIHADKHNSNAHVLLDDVDSYPRFRLLYSCMTQFLQSIEDHTMRPGLLDTRTWVSIFFSFCIFSVVRTLLVDRASQSRLLLPPQAGASAMHAVFKALVAIFAWSTPMLLDAADSELGHSDRYWVLLVHSWGGGLGVSVESLRRLIFSCCWAVGSLEGRASMVFYGKSHR
jgi:hypothetical protein